MTDQRQSVTGPPPTAFQRNRRHRTIWSSVLPFEGSSLDLGFMRRYLSTVRMSRPVDISLGDHIRIETGDTAFPAVVTLILEDSCEALYIDDAGRVIAEEVQWREGAWRFAHLTPTGIDAEDSGRLRPFIMKLRGKAK